MASFSFTAGALLSFGRKPPASDAQWAIFADKVGQSVLPFIVRPDRLDAVPFAKLGMRPVRLSDMVPQQGEMWVLFCFKDSFRNAVSPDSPLRTDGFPLVLEWRRGQDDSPLLSCAFHDLAERVRRQIGEAGRGWGLHPAFNRYADRTSFVDPALFSDAENSLQVASAWGALAAGLRCCVTGKFPRAWTFPSIQWDWDGRKTLGVAGVAQKLSVAADCGADTVMVAADQWKGAAKALRELKKGSDGKRFGDLCLYVAKDVPDANAVADDIAWGPSRKRKRKWLFSTAAILLFAMTAGLFLWQHNEKDVAVQRQHVVDLPIDTMPRDLRDADVERALDDLGELKASIDLPEAQSMFVRQLALRNWLVPIDVRPCEESATDFTNSCLKCEAQTVSVADEVKQCSMFWVPFDFPVAYVSKGATLEALDAKSRETKWESDFQSDTQEMDIVETWRVNPSGLVGIAEVVTMVDGGGLHVTKRELIIKNPFSGQDRWRQETTSEISAFSFSGNGRRFAYALSDGCIFLRECATGMLVALPKRFGTPVRALAFSDDDSVLHVQTDGKDVSLAVVYQLPVDVSDGVGPILVRPAGRDDAQDMRNLCSLLADVGIPDGRAIADCCKSGGHPGAFMRNALKHSGDRWVNFLWAQPISDKVGTMLEESKPGESKANCQKALDLLPDACRPLTEWLIYSINEIARRNRRRELGCSKWSDQLMRIGFENDLQATWHGEFVLRYALRQHPSDAKAREKASIFLERTGRKSIVPLRKCPSVQAISRTLALKNRDIATLRDKLEEVKKELAFRRARNDTRFAPQKGDEVTALWGKMLKLMACGTDEGAIRCLEAYAAAPATIDQEGEREKFVPAVRQFILERKGRKISGGVVVMRYAPPATSHRTFDIGDIVVAVNGVRNVSVDGYSQIKKATDGDCVLDILRYDAASETFRELKVPLAKGQCPVMMRDLAE